MARPPRSKPGPPRPPRPKPSWFALNAPAGVSAGEARLHEQLVLGLAAALGVAMLLMVLGPHRIGDYFTETDFYGAYAQGARLIQRGQMDPSRYGVVGPVYEIVLALVGFIVRDLFLAAELISLASTLGALLLWFDLLRRRVDTRLALIAALFMAANPTLFRYGYSATTDALALVLQALALWALFTRSGPRAAVLAGALAGVAFLTRYTAIYLLPAGLVALLAGSTVHGSRRRAALLFAAGFAAPVVPWVLFSLAHGGEMALQLHHNIAYDVFARARGITWDEYQQQLQPQFRSLWDVIARDPGAVAARELFNVYDHLRLDATKLLGWPVAASAAVGLLLALLDGTARRLRPLGMAALLLFLALVPAFYSERYSLALLPFYATLAGAAFASPLAALALGPRRGVWLKPALMVLPLALSVQASIKLQARVVSQLPLEVLEASRTLRRLREPGDRLIARKPHAAFHGHVEPLAFPFTRTLPELATYAREQRARWLYFSWPEAEMRPDYWYLLDTTGVVPGLVPRFVSRRHVGVLYEIGPEFGTRPGWFDNDTLVAWHNARARLMVNPADTLGLYTLGMIDRLRGRLDPARRRLEQLVRLKPYNLDYLLLLGDVCLNQGDGPRATEVYLRAERVSPGSLDARLGRGWGALVSRQPQDAAMLWRPLVRQTRDPATLQRMIQLYHALGDAQAEAEARATLAGLRTGR